MISREKWLGGPLVNITVAGGFMLPPRGPRMFRITFSSGTHIRMPDARLCDKGWPIFMVNGVTDFRDFNGTAIESIAGGTASWGFVGLVENTTAAGKWWVMEMGTLV